MAAPTTIIEYVTQRRDNAQLALTATQQQLATAQAALSDSIAVLAVETALLDSLNKTAAELRQKLAAVPTPADGEPLLIALEQITIRQRASQSKIVDIQGEILIAQSDVTAAQDDLAAASATLNDAESDFTQAAKPGEQRDEWITKLDAEPLASLHTAATKALDLALAEGAVFKKAKERIEADIPAKLLERAEQRHDAEVTRLKDAAAKTTTATAAVVAERKKSHLAANAADLWTAFRSVESATGEHVASASARFAQSATTLTAVGDENNSPLTPEQIARINDAALQPDREAAAAEEKNVHDKRKDLDDKQAILDDAIVAAKADPTNAAKAQDVVDAQADVATARVDYITAHDVWIDKLSDYRGAIHNLEDKQKTLNAARQAAIAAGVDPETDPDVQVALVNVVTAEMNLKTAEDLYRASSHGILHAWEAAVPDSTWRIFEQYKQAQQTLTDLKSPSAAAVKQRLLTAETDYLTAQLKADASASVLSQLTAEQIRRATREAAAREVFAARLFSALRGDD
jgi:hypothetical protein